jgi:hypothetical protein
VSASAVQVTFGLKNYKMQHFKDIYVLADAYRMDDDEELYIGHVAPDGIYLSWNIFYMDIPIRIMISMWPCMK